MSADVAPLNGGPGMLLDFSPELSIECSVCLDLYECGTRQEDGAIIDRRPVALPCGHSICRTCFLALHHKRCPQCKFVLQNEAPISYGMIELIEKCRSEVKSIKERVASLASPVPSDSDDMSADVSTDASADTNDVKIRIYSVMIRMRSKKLESILSMLSAEEVCLYDSWDTVYETHSRQRAIERYRELCLEYEKNTFSHWYIVSAHVVACAVDEDIQEGKANEYFDGNVRLPSRHFRLK
jgi:RING-type zinc-finger